MNREKLKEHLIGLAHSCNCTLGQMIFVSTGMVMLVGSVVPSPSLYISAMATGCTLAWLYRSDLRS